MRIARATMAVLAGLGLLAGGPARGLDAPGGRRTPTGSRSSRRRSGPCWSSAATQCHSAGSEKVKGGLRLDHREGMVKGGDGGPVDRAGQARREPADRGDPLQGRAPPDAPQDAALARAGRRLRGLGQDGRPRPARRGPRRPSTRPPRPEIDIAKARAFWSFRPVADPPVPAVKDAAWPRNDVDRFVLARLEAAGLAPVARRRQADADPPGHLRPDRPAADARGGRRLPRRRVARRLRAGRRPAARLARLRRALGPALARPGPLRRHRRLQLRLPRPLGLQVSRLRHRGLQRATSPTTASSASRSPATCCPASPRRPSTSGSIATGYLAIARRFGSSPTEFHLTLDDAIDNLGKAFLGLSVGCARCHDHKFDPIPQADYYALYGIFDSSEFAYPGLENARRARDFVALGTPEEAEALRQLRGRGRPTSKSGSGSSTGRRTPPEGGPDARADRRPRSTRSTARLKRARRPARRRSRRRTPSPRGRRTTPRSSEGRPRPPRRRRSPAGSSRSSAASGCPTASRPGERPAGAGRLADRPGEPADRPGDGQPDLAAPLRPGDRRHAQRLRRPGQAARPTPSCSTTWPPGSSGTAGRSRRCTGGSCSRGPTSSPPPTTRAPPRSTRPTTCSGGTTAAGSRPRRSATPCSPSPARSTGRRAARSRCPPESEFRYTQHVQFVAPESFDTRRRTVYLIQQRLRRRRILEVFDGADPNVDDPRPPAEHHGDPGPLPDERPVRPRPGRRAGRPGRGRLGRRGRADRPGLPPGLRPPRDRRRGRGRPGLPGRRPPRAGRGRACPTDRRPRAALESLVRVLLGSNEFLFVD